MDANRVEGNSVLVIRLPKVSQARDSGIVGRSLFAEPLDVDHWVQILTDTPKEILYAAADAERISEYILTIEQKKEIRHTQEVGTREKTSHKRSERTWLFPTLNATRRKRSGHVGTR
jgi:antirestriction protein ArdC